MNAKFSLATFAVESDVPVREFINELGEFSKHGVQPVCSHLFFDDLDDLLTASQNPTIHDIC